MEQLYPWRTEELLIVAARQNFGRVGTARPFFVSQARDQNGLRALAHHRIACRRLFPRYKSHEKGLQVLPIRTPKLHLVEFRKVSSPLAHSKIDNGTRCSHGTRVSPHMKPSVDHLKDSSSTKRLVAPWECTREWALIDSPKADSQ